MGSVCTFSIGDYSLDEVKSVINPEWLRVFRECDARRIRTADNDAVEDTEFPYDTSFEYVAPINVIKERLDILGYSLTNIKHQFEIHKNHLADDYEEESLDDDDLIRVSTFLRSSTLNDWMAAYSEIFSKKLYNWERESITPDTPPLIRFILTDQYRDLGVLNFPIYDFNAFLRVFIEKLDNNLEVIMNYTELVHGGYINEHDELCDDFDYDNWHLNANNSKIIIMTEGSTDSEFIEILMELLKTNVWDFYSFLDFKTAKPNGGASYLVSHLKAFIAAGVSNRIIAIFDNDAAGIEGIQQLEKISIPENVKILKYPDISLARDYPTMGPAGLQNMDINGMACSIELYLGKDVLLDGDSLMPIHWRGYIDSIKRYQGEIAGKQTIQDRFRKKFTRIAKGESSFGDYDWSEGIVLVDAICKAFTGE